MQLFDEKMKAAVPEEKLKALWTEQLAALGDFREWNAAPGPPNQGFDLTLAALKFERGELKAAVYVDPKTKLIAGFFLKPVSVPAASPAAYVDTTRFQAVAITVGSDPFVLSGTLTVPRGPGPFPGVVLVHGSGPQDRDETIGANKVFKDLAEGLSSRGIAVLRYEKRTKQYGAKMADTTTLEEEVLSDAIAAVRALRARPEVDPNRTFVVGHSLGALLAPEIAVRSGSAAGVVLLGPRDVPRGTWCSLRCAFSRLHPKSSRRWSGKRRCSGKGSLVTRSCSMSRSRTGRTGPGATASRWPRTGAPRVDPPGRARLPGR